MLKMTDANTEFYRNATEYGRLFRKAMNKWDKLRSINEWVRDIGEHVQSKGFVIRDKVTEFWRALCLIHSELSEMAEDFHQHGKITANGREELADTVIRCFDFAHRFNINLEQEIIHKMAANALRPYQHGKKG